jgi:hypothetical protein
VLDPKEVRSSITRRLELDAAGLPEAGRHVEGIVELMLCETRRMFGGYGAARHS